MSTVSPLEMFIKKYKNAIASRSKDIRLSIEEATDVLTAFATINTSNEDLSKVLLSLKNSIQSLQQDIKSPGIMDGGKFK